MAQEIINIGSGENTGDGDNLRASVIKTNNNFSELYLQSGHASYTDTIHVDLASSFLVPANTDTVIPINAGTIYNSEKPNDIDEFYFSGALNLTSITGSFVLNETITGGTSGTTAVVRKIDGSVISFVNNSGAFTDTETITGSTSGATATVSSSKTGYIPGRNNDNLDIMLYFKAVPTSASQWIDIWIDITGDTGTPASLADLYRDTKEFPKGAGVERGILYSLSSAYTRDTWEANGGQIKVRSNEDFNIYKINVNFDTSYRSR